eukprot:4552-Amphidinium_carterae.2
MSHKVSGRSSVQTMSRDDLHRNNMAVLQQLEDTTLGQGYQEHLTSIAKFLGQVTAPEEGVLGGTLAGTPAPEPLIIGQTKRRVGVTLTPGPVITSKEFENVDLVLVDQHVTRQQVPEIMLTEGTVMSTFRIRGIALENPLKARKVNGEEGVPGGTLAGTPDNIEKVEVYIDYLNAKGIESESVIRYPTRN